MEMTRSKSARVLLVILPVVGALAGFFYWSISGGGFSAREKPSKLEAFAARQLRYLATPSEAQRLENPLEATEWAIAEGRDHFADHCAICHANNGSGNTEINSGLYPPAPDMRTGVTQDLTDGEIFYIIENGIRFTGMPGWGEDDEENWKLVIFIRHLPDITPEEIEFMREINGLEH